MRTWQAIAIGTVASLPIWALAAVFYPKRFTPGAETIHAHCPRTWRVIDDGEAWRYLCPETSAEIVFLKSAPNAGLSAETAGDSSADWRR